MSSYIESLKGEGYISLRDQYLAPQVAFPSLQQGQGGKSSLVEVLAKVDDADHMGDEDEDEDGKTASDKVVSASSPISISASMVSEEMLKPPEQSQVESVKSPEPGRQHQWKLETNFEKFISGNSKAIKEGDIEKYANYCLEERLVMLDPDGDPKKAAYGPGGESEFLKYSKKTASGFKTREGKLKTVIDMVWSQLRDPLMQNKFKVGQVGGGKKGRLFSQSSPSSKTDTRSKSLRVESPVKP